MQYWKKLKTEKLPTLTKYLMKFGRQDNLTTYFSNNTTQSINKAQQRNGQKAVSSPSLKKATLDSLRTTEA